jgi:hypothetical protein
MGLPESETLVSLKKEYEELTSENRGTISTLASLEEIIIQIRCKEVINSELRLSLSRNYIYARSTFYRRGNKINDIRVVVGTTEDHGTDLRKLHKDKIFRDVCISTLKGHMDKEINANIANLKTIVKV